MKGVIKIGTIKIGFLPEGTNLLIEIANVKHKVKKVYVPLNSEAYIDTYYIGDEQIQNGQDCEAKIIGKKAVITQLTIGAIPSHGIKETIKKIKL